MVGSRHETSKHQPAVPKDELTVIPPSHNRLSMDLTNLDLYTNFVTISLPTLRTHD